MCLDLVVAAGRSALDLHIVSLPDNAVPVGRRLLLAGGEKGMRPGTLYLLDRSHHNQTAIHVRPEVALQGSAHPAIPVLQPSGNITFDGNSRMSPRATVRAAWQGGEQHSSQP